MKTILKFIPAVFLLLAACGPNEEGDIVPDGVFAPVENWRYNESGSVRTDGSLLDFASYDEFQSLSDYENAYQGDRPLEEKYPLGLQPQHPQQLAYSLEFYSLGHLYEDALEAQAEYWKEFVAWANEADPELVKAKMADPNHRWAPFVLQHKDVLVLEEEGTITLGQVDLAQAYLLNPKGIVVAQGIIYQHTPTQIKAITSGDYTLLPALLQASRTVKDKQIFVNTFGVDEAQGLERTQGSLSKQLIAEVYARKDEKLRGGFDAYNYSIQVPSSQANISYLEGWQANLKNIVEHQTFTVCPPNDPNCDDSSDPPTYVTKYKTKVRMWVRYYDYNGKGGGSHDTGYYIPLNVTSAYCGSTRLYETATRKWWQSKYWEETKLHILSMRTSNVKLYTSGGTVSLYSSTYCDCTTGAVKVLYDGNRVSSVSGNLFFNDSADMIKFDLSKVTSVIPPHYKNSLGPTNPSRRTYVFP